MIDVLSEDALRCIMASARVPDMLRFAATCKQLSSMRVEPKRKTANGDALWLDDYKFELHALTAIDHREEKVEGLRNHIKDANLFLQEAEKEMEK